MYRIGVSARARRQLKKLAKKDRAAFRLVSDGIESLADWPETKSVRALRSHESDYRLRIGRFRVLFDVDETRRIVVIREVVRRSERTY
jgi:mRNA interferase RelE/StbE